MSTYQKVLIVGNMTKDPEIKYTSSGVAVCSVSVATNRRWKDKASGEMQEEAEFHRCVAYDRLAEIFGEYTKKGSKVLVEGRLKTRKWEKDGVTHYTTEIVCESMQMLDNKPNESRSQAAKPTTKSAGESNAMDDDIPF